MTFSIDIRRYAHEPQEQGTAVYVSSKSVSACNDHNCIQDWYTACLVPEQFICEPYPLIIPPSHCNTGFKTWCLQAISSKPQSELVLVDSLGLATSVIVQQWLRLYDLPAA